MNVLTGAFTSAEQIQRYILGMNTLLGKKLATLNNCWYDRFCQPHRDCLQENFMKRRRSYAGFSTQINSITV